MIMPGNINDNNNDNNNNNNNNELGIIREVSVFTFLFVIVCCVYVVRRIV